MSSLSAWKYVGIYKTIGGVLSRRQFSVTTKKCLPKKSLTILDVDHVSGVATLTMNRPPINALNGELLAAIRTSLKEADKNHVRGLILTSSLRNVFSAGLDITELFEPNVERLRDMWSSMQDVALQLGTLSTPVVALINGHAPAGGCVIATSCEYRVMLPNFTIGLNEPIFGLVAPSWIMETILEALPRRLAELALTKGKLYLTEEAFRVGLVDEVVMDKEEGLLRCEQFIDSFIGVDPVARAVTKVQFRLNKLVTDRKADLEWFVNFVLQPSIQESIGAYLDSLKNKSKK